jgi:hypothetical protein
VVKYAAATYQSTRPFSELCVEGQRTLIIDRWASMVEPTCFDLPFHHPLVEGARCAARGDGISVARAALSNHRGWGVDRSRDEELLQRGHAFGSLLWRRFTPHALKRKVRRLEGRIAELEQTVRELRGEVT